MLKDARTTPAWPRQKRPAPATKDCPHCFSNIALKATPCPSRDGVSSPIGIGQQLGFVRVTPDAVRGAASLLGITGVEPLATP